MEYRVKPDVGNYTYETGSSAPGGRERFRTLTYNVIYKVASITRDNISSCFLVIRDLGMLASPLSKTSVRLSHFNRPGCVVNQPS